MSTHAREQRVSLSLLALFTIQFCLQYRYELEHCFRCRLVNEPLRDPTLKAIKPVLTVQYSLSTATTDGRAK